MYAHHIQVQHNTVNNIVCSIDQARVIRAETDRMIIQCTTKKYAELVGNHLENLGFAWGISIGKRSTNYYIKVKIDINDPDADLERQWSDFTDPTFR